MATYDSKKTIVLAKYGAATTSADVVDILNPEQTFVSKTVSGGKYKPATGAKGSQESWANTDNITGSVSLSCYLKANDSGATALDTPPGLSDIFQICCMTETIDSTTPSQETVTYTMNNGAPSALSEVIVYNDGKKDTFTNPLGDLTVTFTAGETIDVSATITGFTNAAPVAEANPSYVADTEPLIIAKSTDNVSINGVARCAQSVVFKTNNMNNPRYCIGSKAHDNTDFEPTIEVSWFDDSAHSDDIWTLLTNDTEFVFLATCGASSGSKAELKAYAAKVDPTTTPTRSDVNGKILYTATLFCKNDGSGNIVDLKYGYFA
jgi:hypothetical protein